MEWTTIFTCIMTSLTTITVAILGLHQSKKAKETEDYRKIRDQLETEREKESERKSMELEKRFKALEKAVNSVQEDVKDLKEGMKAITDKDLIEISDQLKHLHSLQIGSFKCMESVSDVVIIIGTALDDSTAVSASNKKKLADAIDEHKKSQTLIRSELYNIIA